MEGAESPHWVAVKDQSPRMRLRSMKWRELGFDKLVERAKAERKKATAPARKARRKK